MKQPRVLYLVAAMGLTCAATATIIACGDDELASTGSPTTDSGPPVTGDDTGDDTPIPDSDADVPVGDASPATDANDGGGLCTSLVNTTAPNVQFMAVKGDMPAGKGGTIKDGTYILTAVGAYDPDGPPTGVLYPACSDDAGEEGLTEQATYRVTGNKVELALRLGDLCKPDNESKGIRPSITQTFTIDGNKYQGASVCGGSGAPPAGRTFTATDDQITFYFRRNGSPVFEVYTRQGVDAGPFSVDGG